jgi:GTP-binding protein
VFVDEARVNVRAGDGGAGVVAFQSMRGRPRGKPGGGNGGPGGDVIVVADPSVATLLDFKRRPHRRAGNGAHGRGDLQHGRRGDHLVLLVPVGTVIRDGADTVVADLAKPGQQVRLLEGGRGGRGNAAFVSSRHLAPNFCEQGEYGEDSWFTFELKLVADAALIGFPNAGKSTLISRVSAAKPKIADYPFTTLQPNLGVVVVDDREFTLADIPGLIEGAAEGRGLGHEFLRHVERARALVILLDPSPLQDTDVVVQLEVLLRELEEHSSDLIERPRVIVVSKADLPESVDAAERLAAAGVDAAVVSAVTGDGLDHLMHEVADAVATAARVLPQREGFVLHRPVPPGFEIRREGERWIVEGRQAERAVALDDLTRPEAADFAAGRLARAGVDDALRRAGAVPGDEVQIGDIVFEFHDPEAVPDSDPGD